MARSASHNVWRQWIIKRIVRWIRNSHSSLVSCQCFDDFVGCSVTYQSGDGLLHLAVSSKNPLINYFFLKQLKHILCTLRNEHCRLFVFADSLWAKAAPPIATIHRVLSIYCYSFTSDFLAIITQIGFSHEVIGNGVVRTYVWSFVASNFSSV